MDNAPDRVYTTMPPAVTDESTTVYARYVAYTEGGDKREFRLEIRGPSNMLYAVADNGNERNHGGRIGMDRARENAANWARIYEDSAMFQDMGFMRVI